MSRLFDLSGKVALVTGGSKGMGKSMAEAMAAHGAKVVISSRKVEQCEKVALSINEKHGPGTALAVGCNISHKEELEELVARTRADVGPIDVLCANAGVNAYYGSMATIPDEAFDKTMHANVRSNHWLAQMVVPDMVAKGKGSIMMTSSVNAFQPSDVLGTYGISKLALIGLVRNLAMEYGPQGVRANAICPGLVRTNFSKALWDTPDTPHNVATKTPLRRLGTPSDFEGIAVFLASDASSYMTGQSLTICGGTDMWT